MTSRVYEGSYRVRLNCVHDEQIFTHYRALRFMFISLMCMLASSFVYIYTKSIPENNDAIRLNRLSRIICHAYNSLIADTLFFLLIEHCLD